MQNKKGFTLIELMIVVAIVAILAMIAVPMYQRYIERSRNTAAQNMLQQVALAEVAFQTDSGVKATGLNIATTGYLTIDVPGDSVNVTELLSWGFRPDPNVAFKVLPPAAATESGFVAWACHTALGSRLFVYDNISGGGVQEVRDGSVYASAVPTQLLQFRLDPSVATATLMGTNGTVDLDVDATDNSIRNVAATLI